MTEPSVIVGSLLSEFTSFFLPTISSRSLLFADSKLDFVKSDVVNMFKDFLRTGYFDFVKCGVVNMVKEFLRTGYFDDHLNLNQR